MNRRIIIVLLATFFYLSVSAQDKPLQWTMVQPGIWKATIGQPATFSLLSAMQNIPRTKALADLPVTNFPLPINEIAGNLAAGQVTLRFPLEKEEAIYGLGLNFQTVNQRGRVLNLHMDHYGNSDNGRSHAPVPFYVSSRGYGVLIDAARYITVYAGTANRKAALHPPAVKDRNTDTTWESQPYSDAIEINLPGEGVDVYVFAGPTPMNAVQRYNLFNGGGCLPPAWGLGFTQRVPALYDQQAVIREAKEFEQHQFPLNFIGLEPGWQSSAYPCTLEWDSTRFPHPREMLQLLSGMGIRTNLWFNPYLSPKSTLYKKMLPFSGSHTVWNGIVPDITMPEAREILQQHFEKNHLDAGVAAYKIDEVDGYDHWIWPDVATFPSGHSGEQMRQVYGLLWQKMTLAWFKKRNQRTYGLVRGSNAGASSMPYVIYNDYYSHKDFITALINSSFIGVLWVPEVRASASAEEWVRRMQTVCFSPMAMLDAWSDGTKPGTYPAVEKAVHEVAMLRMQLLPYLYNSFAQYYFEGKPPFRAMELTDGFNPLTEIKDQYMMGDYLLVAPMFTGDTSRTVYLPAGKWYNFYTGEFAGENQAIVITPGVAHIPLFVKDGAIIPMIPAQRQAPQTGKLLPLEIRHYGTAENSASLYDDDGTTFNFEKGEYLRVPLIVKRTKTGILAGNQPISKKSRLFHYLPAITWKWMTTKSEKNK